MKNTLIKIIVIAFLFSGISCSSDSDGTPNPPTYRVKQMTSTSTSIPSSNQTITFSYDSQNRISNYVVTKSAGTLTHNITYNSNGKISEISRTTSSSTTSITTLFQFIYSGDVLTQLVIPGSVNYVMPFTYNAAQKKYTGNDGTGTIYEIRFDDNGNIIQFVSATENNNISYNTNSGIFSPSVNTLPLFITNLFSADGNTKYIAQLFSNREIAAIETASSTLTTATTRNSGNLISQIRYLNGSTNVFTIDYTFEAQE